MLAAPVLQLPFARAADQAPAPASGDGMEIERKWGIREVTVRRTASGAIIDVRYRITDGKKAEAFLNPRNVLRLIHQDTGREMPIAQGKLGKMRQVPADPGANRVYFSLFSNQGGLVKSKDRVTLLMGEVKIEDLQVV